MKDRWPKISETVIVREVRGSVKVCDIFEGRDFKERKERMEGEGGTVVAVDFERDCDFERSKVL